jgi:hypothetical protein
MQGSTGRMGGCWDAQSSQGEEAHHRAELRRLGSRGDIWSCEAGAVKLDLELDRGQGQAATIESRDVGSGPLTVMSMWSAFPHLHAEGPLETGSRFPFRSQTLLPRPAARGTARRPIRVWLLHSRHAFVHSSSAPSACLQWQLRLEVSSPCSPYHKKSKQAVESFTRPCMVLAEPSTSHVAKAQALWPRPLALTVCQITANFSTSTT